MLNFSSLLCRYWHPAWFGDSCSKRCLHSDRHHLWSGWYRGLPHRLGGDSCSALSTDVRHQRHLRSVKKKKISFTLNLHNGDSVRFFRDSLRLLSKKEILFFLFIIMFSKISKFLLAKDKTTQKCESSRSWLRMGEDGWGGSVNRVFTNP